jgi:hypothetical protein
MLHLPDLPNAGYATRRERELSDVIMTFMREVERDRVRLLTIVIEGRDRWRKVAGEIWRGHRIGEDHQLLNAIYDYFTLQACPPLTQYRLLRNSHNALRWRDIVKQAMPDIEREREALRRLADRPVGFVNG